MSTERIKGKVAFYCDFAACNESIETTQDDFIEARAEAKDAGWLTRNRDGVWKHFCCHAHEQKEWMGQKV